MDDTLMDTPRKGGSRIYVALVSAVAALGGLLFGYDTGVISGAIGPLVERFGLDSTMEGWAASCALVGCMVGAALAGTLSDHLGRKKVLILSAVCFFISAVGTALPRNLVEFILFRFLGGLGVGAASMTSPMYIAEISPARIRGRMVSLNQFAIVSGFLVVYFANYIIGGVGLAKDLVILKDKATSPTSAVSGGQRSPVPPDIVASEFLTNWERHYDLTDPAEAEGLRYDVLAGLGIQSTSIAAGHESLRSVVRDEMIALLESGSVPLADAEAFSAALSEQVGKKWMAEGKPASGLPSAEAFRDLVSTAAASEPVVRAIIADLAREGLSAWNVRLGWRWMFGSEALPALLLLVLAFFVPESPRWLTQRGRAAQALGILSRVDGPDYAQAELAEIREAIAHESASIRQLIEPGLRVALMIGVILAILQQITGINAVLYYAPEIFKNIGADTQSALWQTVIVGAVNILFTVVAIAVVDRLGRKPLMLAGSAGMGVCLGLLGWAFYAQQTGLWVFLAVLGYIACFAMAVGPVTWVILSEIFPTRIRGRAMAIATVILWIACYAVSQTFPMLNKNPWLVEHFHHGFSFWLYGLFCVVEVVFVALCVPETRGRSLEQIERMWRPTGPHLLDRRAQLTPTGSPEQGTRTTDGNQT